MGKVLRLINGIARQVDMDDVAAPPIYDESLVVVEADAGVGEILGPISAGTPITLPNEKTYESDELEIYFRGQRIEHLFDYNYVGDIPRTQIIFTFDLEVSDIIRFRIDRSA